MIVYNSHKHKCVQKINNKLPIKYLLKLCGVCKHFNLKFKTKYVIEVKSIKNHVCCTEDVIYCNMTYVLVNEKLI